MQQDVGTQKEDQLISRSAQGCHTGYVRLFFSMSAQQSDLDAVKARDPSALRSPRIMPAIGGKRKQPETATDIDLVALHRARIVDWSPTAVTALAASADGTVVAAARESGSIEIWSTAHWQCIKVVDSPKPRPLAAALRCMLLTRIRCSAANSGHRVRIDIMFDVDTRSKKRPMEGVLGRPGRVVGRVGPEGVTSTLSF